MNREAKIAEKIVVSAVAQWAREIPYDFAVAMGEIPAYQTYLGTTTFIERGRAFLRNKKREVIAKRGQQEYDELVRAFDDLADAWENIGIAEEDMSKAQQHLGSLKAKYSGLRKATIGWD